jgi:glycosyltransferase involved in cell wall biosynthesis
MDETNQDVILSICIPTFNRADFLEKTVLSVVSQNCFIETNKVEIVISDNCSDDKTREVSEKFVEIYGGKIRYFRNSENIKDANFEKALSYGRGTYLKLNNDTLMYNENSLNNIIETINANSEKKNIVLFSNGFLRKEDKMFFCENLDSFVRKVSFWSTWIGCFGIWKTDFDLIPDFNLNINLQLVQTDVLLRLLSSNRSVMVNNTEIFTSVNPKTKGGYDFYRVFVTNYLGLLKTYRDKNHISWITLFNEKSKLMIQYLVPMTAIFISDRHKYSFSFGNALSVIIADYKFHPALFLGFFFLTLRIILYQIKGLLKLNKKPG